MNFMFVCGFALVAADLFSTVVLDKPIIKAGYWAKSMYPQLENDEDGA
jgi:hypothetical protein